MKSCAVFCGSQPGANSAVQDATRDLGRALALSKTTVVYGGGRVGLMGMVADAALAAGGRVIGVIPHFLNRKEVAHPGLTQLIEVENMHQRKAKMFELAEGFVALPGGFGTLEEIIEVLTWRQLKLHEFPVAFLNLNGFYANLQKQFIEMEAVGFLHSATHRLALFGSEVAPLLDEMRRQHAEAAERKTGLV